MSVVQRPSQLTAERLHDRQISETLFISLRTSSYHVAHVLAKLGINSRTAAATFAIGDGLVS